MSSGTTPDRVEAVLGVDSTTEAERRPDEAVLDTAHPPCPDAPRPERARAASAPDEAPAQRGGSTPTRPLSLLRRLVSRRRRPEADHATRREAESLRRERELREATQRALLHHLR